jgi:hypothetical protein
MDDETTPHFVRSFVRRWEEEDSVNPLYLRRQQNPAHLLPTWLAPCSGLPVMRYGVDALSAVCGPAFDLVDTQRYVHTTPRGIAQSFMYTTFRRTARVDHFVPVAR